MEQELQNLVNKSSAILNLKDENLRDEFVKIAKEETPTQAKERAIVLGDQHFDRDVSDTFAKACRWLAVIRREYGIDVFNKVVNN